MAPHTQTVPSRDRASPGPGLVLVLSGLVLLGLALLVVGCVPSLDRAPPGADRGGSADAWSSQGDDGPLYHSDALISTGDMRDADGCDGADDAVTDGVGQEQGAPLADAASPPDSGATGKWYQADSAHCPTHCSGLGLTNGAGPEGAHCMSGEVRSASGIAQGITFTYGCWGPCTPMGKHTATSTGKYCYKPGQKQDGDKTDLTVGCFCRP